MRGGLRSRIEEAGEHAAEAINRSRIPFHLHPEQRAVPGCQQKAAEIGCPIFVARPEQSSDRFKSRRLLREHGAQLRAEGVTMSRDLSSEIGNDTPALPLRFSRSYRNAIEIRP